MEPVKQGARDLMNRGHARTFSATDQPTTVMTLNFTGSNDTLAWNITRELHNTTADMNLMTTTSSVLTTTTEATTTMQEDGTTSNTTMFPGTTTEMVFMYMPQCVANLTDGCDSCLRNPFFWTRGPNDTDVEPGVAFWCEQPDD